MPIKIPPIPCLNADVAQGKCNRNDPRCRLDTSIPSKAALTIPHAKPEFAQFVPELAPVLHRIVEENDQGPVVSMIIAFDRPTSAAPAESV